ncbi:MAG: hypothetical protein ABSF26_03125 [Thermoguttaceae bacterium]|jgi:hypothetical protein
MWRAFFLAIGLYLVIFGMECLAVDQVYLRAHEAPRPAAGLFQSAAAEGPPLTFAPSPWMPWSFLSSGIVVCLYSFTIPRRLGK